MSHHKKRGLSRGLDALLAGTGLLQSTVPEASSKPITSKTIKKAITKENSNSITLINTTQLTPGKLQPRRSIPKEELAELVESIQRQGILQPLIVRKIADHYYEIIAGERRWQAAILAKLEVVPIIIKQVDDKDALTIALIENIQRENLNPLDEAIALNKLTQEFCLTHNQVAAAVGKSRTGITNLLRLLQLPIEIKLLLEKNKITLGHAKVILSAPAKWQVKLAHKIVEQNLSVRATEILLTQYQNLNSITNLNQTNSKTEIDPDLKQLQQRLSDTLGARVTVNSKQNGSGKLIIKYNSLDELEGILDLIHTCSEDYST